MFCLGLLICLQKLHEVLLNTKASSGRYCWLRNVFWRISVILLTVATADESAEAGGSQLHPDIWSVSLASLMNSCRLVLCYRGKKVHSWKWASSSLPLPQTPHDASCVQIMCTQMEKKTGHTRWSWSSCVQESAIAQSTKILTSCGILHQLQP